MKPVTPPQRALLKRLDRSHQPVFLRGHEPKSTRPLLARGLIKQERMKGSKPSWPSGWVITTEGREVLQEVPPVIPATHRRKRR